MTKVERMMEQHGFMQMDTGGGCVAYEKVVQVLITCANGCTVPENISDPVCMGMYDVETNDTISVHFFDSLVDALKK